MAKRVVYDFMKLRDPKDEIIDGSDEFLPENERFSEADMQKIRSHPYYGQLKALMEEVEAEKKKDKD